MNKHSHISQQFEKELYQLKKNLLDMGDLLVNHLGDVIDTIENRKANTKNTDVIEKAINDLEIYLDDECVRLLAIHRPAASDLRFVISASRIVNDMESMGDEITRISYIVRTLLKSMGKDHDTQFFVDIRQISKNFSELLRNTLKAYREDDYNLAAELVVAERDMDAMYDNAVRSRITLIMEEPRNVKTAVHCFGILRSLERIGKCTRQINNHTIYRVRGMDVRHMSKSRLKEKFMR